MPTQEGPGNPGPSFYLWITMPTWRVSIADVPGPWMTLHLIAFIHFSNISTSCIMELVRITISNVCATIVVLVVIGIKVAGIAITTSVV